MGKILEIFPNWIAAPLPRFGRGKNKNFAETKEPDFYLFSKIRLEIFWWRKKGARQMPYPTKEMEFCTTPNKRTLNR